MSWNYVEGADAVFQLSEVVILILLEAIYYNTLLIRRIIDNTSQAYLNGRC